MMTIAAALFGAAVLFSGTAHAAAFQPTRVEMSDVVIGVGTTGPYALSWNDIAVASERVEVNGVPLLRGIDYTVDWKKGTVTLARPLPTNSVAQVSYLRQPGQSQVNQQPVDLPAAIPLGSIGDADVALALRYQHLPSGDPRGVYGLRAGRKGDTRVDAALFFSELAAASGRSEGEPRRAAGWRIGAERSYSQLDLAASLTRAEEGFAAPNDLPAKGGQETLNVAAGYRPARDLTARASVTTVEDIANPNRPTTHTTEYGLAAKPLAGADLTLTRTEIELQQGSGSSTTTTDRVQAAMALGASTKASAAYQTSVAGESRSDARSLRVASSLRDGLNVVASHSETHSDSGQQRASDVSLDVATWRAARVRATMGARRGTEVSDYQGVEATLKPASRLSLEAGYKQRDYGDTELNMRRAAIAVSPVKSLEISGEYAENPEDKKGVVREATSTKVGAATRLGIIGLSGSVARQIAAPGDEQRAGEVRLSLNLAASHKIYTGYRQIETIPLGGVTTAETEVYLLGYDYAIGRDFSLSVEGQMERSREYQQFRSDTEQRADAKLNWRF